MIPHAPWKAASCAGPRSIENNNRHARAERCHFVAQVSLIRHQSLTSGLPVMRRWINAGSEHPSACNSRLLLWRARRPVWAGQFPVEVGSSSLLASPISLMESAYSRAAGSLSVWLTVARGNRPASGLVICRSTRIHKVRVIPLPKSGSKTP